MDGQGSSQATPAARGRPDAPRATAKRHVHLCPTCSDLGRYARRRCQPVRPAAHHARLSTAGSPRTSRTCEPVMAPSHPLPPTHREPRADLSTRSANQAPRKGCLTCTFSGAGDEIRSRDPHLGKSEWIAAHGRRRPVSRHLRPAAQRVRSSAAHVVLARCWQAIAGFRSRATCPPSLQGECRAGRTGEARSPKLPLRGRQALWPTMGCGCPARRSPHPGHARPPAISSCSTRSRSPLTMSTDASGITQEGPPRPTAKKSEGVLARTNRPHADAPAPPPPTRHPDHASSPSMTPTQPTSSTTAASY